jgi:hypothetical protein
MKARKQLQRKKRKQTEAVTNTVQGPKAPKEFAEMYPDLKKEGWGKDKLTKEIEIAFCNIGVAFINLKPYFQLLEKAFEIFDDACKSLTFSMLDSLIANSLFGRAAGCFLGAVRLSCSGQLTETWVLLRACLENSLYAFYIFGNPERAKIWINRHSKDKESKKKCKNTFVIKKILDELSAKSPKIAKEAEKWYNISIDWGGHPNERSLSQNLEQKQNGSGFDFIFIHSNQVLIKTTIVPTIVISSILFRIFSLTFPNLLSQPNLAIKIQNLNDWSKPLMHSAIIDLRKLINNKSAT